MSIDAALQAFMREYEKRTNGHDPEPVAELITEDATYWFNDGSFVGHEAIKGALRKTWATIQDETYTIENPQWIAVSETAAACIYTFHWSGLIDGKQFKGKGRGTSVLKKVGDQWKVVHDHLSSYPGG